MWLPLLPRADGLGYELHYEDEWRPSDFRDAARRPVQQGNYSASTETAAAEEQSAAQVQATVGTSVNAPVGAAAEATPAIPPAGVTDFDKRHPLSSASLRSSGTVASNSSAIANAAAQTFAEQLAGSVGALLG